MSIFAKIRIAFGIQAPRKSNERPLKPVSIVFPPSLNQSNDLPLSVPTHSESSAPAIERPVSPVKTAENSIATKVSETTVCPKKSIREPNTDDPGINHPGTRIKILELMYEHPEIVDAAKQYYQGLETASSDKQNDERVKTWNRISKEFIKNFIKPALGMTWKDLDKLLITNIMTYEAMQIRLDEKYPDRHTWQDQIRKANENKAEMERRLNILMRPSSYREYRDQMTPIEYEAFCADILKSNGWQVELTKVTGDQGVDVVARRGRVILALQVKKYSSPVGNSAVQEVHTGKAFYAATHAAVVTNSSYTTSAQALARKAGVALLHHDDLAGFIPR